MKKKKGPKVQEIPTIKPPDQLKERTDELNKLADENAIRESLARLGIPRGKKGV